MGLGGIRAGQKAPVRREAREGVAHHGEILSYPARRRAILRPGMQFSRERPGGPIELIADMA